MSEEEEGGRLRLLLSDFGYACRCDDQDESQLEGAVGSPGFFGTRFLPDVLTNTNTHIDF